MASFKWYRYLAFNNTLYNVILKILYNLYHFNITYKSINKTITIAMTYL